jgi:hypothetical protein
MNGVVSDWMDKQIWPQIWKMMLDDAYFKLLGRARELTGKLNGPVAQIILDGYLTFQTVAIRHLCDPRRDVISLHRAITEAKAHNLAATDLLLDRLGCCDHVCDLVNNYVAHTANPARRPNASAWNLQVPHLIEAQKAICEVAITLDRDIFHRNTSINIIPEPQFNIMEDFTLWASDEVIDKLWRFWHAHKKEVDTWRLR